jgi:hypothetical protein
VGRRRSSPAGCCISAPDTARSGFGRGTCCWRSRRIELCCRDVQRCSAARREKSAPSALSSLSKNVGRRSKSPIDVSTRTRTTYDTRFSAALRWSLAVRLRYRRAPGFIQKSTVRGFCEARIFRIDDGRWGAIDPERSHLGSDAGRPDRGDHHRRHSPRLGVAVAPQHGHPYCRLFADQRIIPERRRVRG